MTLSQLFNIVVLLVCILGIVQGLVLFFIGHFLWGFFLAFVGLSIAWIAYTSKDTDEVSLQDVFNELNRKAKEKITE